MGSGELGPLLRSLLWGNLVILTGMPCGSMVYLIRPPDVLVSHEMTSEWNGMDDLHRFWRLQQSTRMTPKLRLAPASVLIFC